MPFSRGYNIFTFVTKAPRNFFVSRSATSSSNKPIASFEGVKSVGSHQDTVLIDVREPSELKETGVIPNSINIPLGEVEGALRDLPPDEFMKKYGSVKPCSHTNIIFSCMKGIRSGKAQDLAIKLGFKNTQNYEGGWLDWAEKCKCS